MMKDTNLFCKTGFTCPHSKPRRYFCIAFHRLGTGLPVLAVGGFAIFFLIVLVQLAFFRFAPASTFLTITSANIPTTRLGQDMTLQLCRNVRYTGSIKANAVRTFFKVISGPVPERSATYEFKPNIESRNGCQNITIKPDHYPNHAGTYYIYTTLGFWVHGNYKEVSYQTPPFLISDTSTKVDDLIHQLQEQKVQQDMQQNKGRD